MKNVAKQTATEMRDVTPTSEASNVRWFSRSKAQKDITISSTDEHHIAISVFEKYLKTFRIRNMMTSKKPKHPHAHLLRPNDVQTNASNILLLGSSFRSIYFLRCTTRKSEKQARISVSVRIQNQTASESVPSSDFDAVSLLRGEQARIGEFLMAAEESISIGVGLHIFEHQ